jgi:hypothetical protein
MVHGGTSAVGLAADFGVLSLVFLGLLLLAARSCLASFASTAERAPLP